MKVAINIDYDYIMGRLRYGHEEGIVDIPSDEYEEFKADPLEYINKHDLYSCLELILDYYEIDDMGGADITYRELT